MTFEELGLREEVLKSLKELGFEAPTPIQEKAIPYLMKDDCDFVGLAQTGTGKTAAFGLPLINRINSASNRPQGLIICPTRELCMQITRDLEVFSKYMKCPVVSVYGGADIGRQISQIKRGVAIVVATPGRLLDLIKRRALQLSDVQCVVLDEADEMLNMGFKEDIDSILETTPETKNVWLFSATMPKDVERIAKTYMTDPLEVSIGHKNQSNENIEHIYYVVKERDRYEAVKRLIDFHPNIYGLIFCRTKHETATVAEKLGRDGYNAEPLHGDLTQPMRDRVMARFRSKELQILVATDVAARGIDVDDITHVINYNLPDDTENYTHRSGRTARAGKKGQSLVLISPKENYKIKAIEKQMSKAFAQGKIPNAEEICEIQLMKLIQKTIDIQIKEKDIEKFMPQILASFEDMDKTEIIKKFVSAEFNQFIEYYDRAGDVNQRAKQDSGRDRDRTDKGARARDEGKTRFFLSAGKRDGLNPGGLLRVVCDAAGIDSSGIGRIDIMTSYAFFDVDEAHTERILKSVNGTEFEGTKLSVEVTNTQNGGGSGQGRSGGGGGGSQRRSGGGGGGGQRRSGGGEFRRSSGGSNFRSGRTGRDGRRSDSAGDRSGSSDRRSGSDKPRHRGR
ncbi:MAG: DEAD/DEAH box helicase [Crocinitomicaceae bacterium]|tara:strand:- start:9724 stop:11592 length:1869 start_codon:yes stop_codon:yes gene_type:complete